MNNSSRLRLYSKAYSLTRSPHYTNGRYAGIGFWRYLTIGAYDWLVILSSELNDE